MVTPRWTASARVFLFTGLDRLARGTDVALVSPGFPCPDHEQEKGA
jgi:hypothetical protein